MAEERETEFAGGRDIKKCPNCGASAMTTETETLVDAFISSFNALKKAHSEDVDNMKREARLLDIRYRLSLDLRIDIETRFSHTNDKDVRETYKLIFKFLDLWNAYEICLSYGSVLGQVKTDKTGNIKKSDIGCWEEAFLKKMGIEDFLASEVERFKKTLLKTEKEQEHFKDCLKHFSLLDSIHDTQKKKYNKYLDNPLTNFDSDGLLFIQYMERNAYYHGGETAHSGTTYSYRKKMFSFYIDFLTQFVARLGAALFELERQGETK